MELVKSSFDNLKISDELIFKNEFKVINHYIKIGDNRVRLKETQELKVWTSLPKFIKKVLRSKRLRFLTKKKLHEYYTGQYHEVYKVT